MTTSLRQIPKGCFGVRYASEYDHKRLGWIFCDCLSVHSAVQSADTFLLEGDYLGILLCVVDHCGNEQELVSRE